MYTKKYIPARVHSISFIALAMQHSTRTLREARDIILDTGVSIAEWARINGFSGGLVYQVLDGKRKCLRGQSHKIAVALGVKAGRSMNAEKLTQLLASSAPEHPERNSTM